MRNRVEERLTKSVQLGYTKIVYSEDLGEIIALTEDLGPRKPNAIQIRFFSRKRQSINGVSL